MIKFSVINKRIDLHDVDMLTEEPVRFLWGFVCLLVFFMITKEYRLSQWGFINIFAFMGIKYSNFMNLGEITASRTQLYVNSL